MALPTFSITTSQIAVPLLAEYADSLPILMHANRQLDTEFRAGTGVSMNVLIAGVPNVGTGTALTEADLGYTNAYQSVTLEQKNVAIALDAARDAYSFKDKAAQIVGPYGQTLASKIQIRAAQEIQRKAAHHAVLTGTTALVTFGGLSDLTARIQQSRVYGTVWGCLNSIMQSKITATGLTLFNPSTNVSDMFKKGLMGAFSGVDYFASADVENLVTGTLTLAGTANVKTTLTAGATSLTIQAATLTGTVKAGQGFQVAGVNVADIFGGDTGLPYTFVAQADATAAANEITISIQPVYTFADSRPLAIVSEYPQAAAIVTQLQEASSRYTVGLMWNENSFYYASGKLATLTDVMEQTTLEDAPNGIAITVTKGPDAMNIRRIWRADVLSKELLARRQGASVAYFKLA